MPSLSLMEMLPYLRCPASGGPLHLRDSHLESESAERFPVIDGVPYLIRPDNDLFDVDEVARGALASERKSSRQAPLRRIVAGLVPRETRNVGVSRYLAELQATVASRDRRPRIVVVGGAVVGAGLHAFVDDPGFDLVETDVYVDPRTRVVCGS